MMRMRKMFVAVIVLTMTLLVVACSGVLSTSKPATSEQPHVGIVLGGGGETGVAWQVGVLATLSSKAGLTPDVVDVVVGTSAGAVSGSYFSAKLDLNQLVEKERSGEVMSIPLDSGTGMNAIPHEIIAALSSTEGTIEERNQVIGQLAMKASPPITSADMVNYVASMMSSTEWPDLDFRPTSVNAETGATVLWKRSDGIPLTSAIASSVAVPGFLPTIEINGQHYTDAPRASFSASLVAEKKLDAIVYIGMPTPNLSNTIEEEALSKLEEEGLQVIRITGGDGSDEIIQNALDPKLRPLAAEMGLRDGNAAVQSVTKLLQPK